MKWSACSKRRSGSVRSWEWHAARATRSTFSPEHTINEFVIGLHAKIGRVSSGRYAGEWPRETVPQA